MTIGKLLNQDSATLTACCGLLLSPALSAALPTPVAPSNAPAAGNWLELIKGYAKGSRSRIALVCEEIWARNPAESLSTRAQTILFERLFVFHAQIFHRFPVLN